jgi:glycosyltransferase involved in cell wall biosynthesis
MRIAIIGTRGIPPRYGGFETLANELANELAERGHEVIVYGRSGLGQPKRIALRPGLTAHRIPVISIEACESITAGISGSIHALFRFRPDVALVCNPGNVWVSKILQSLGVPVILHMAGLEYKREKWKGLGSRVLRRAVGSAVASKLTLLTDSHAIADWYVDEFNREIEVISYGAKSSTPDAEVLHRYGLHKYDYDLVVARFEPDTQIASIIESHAQSSKSPLVVIGEMRATSSLNLYNQEILSVLKAHPNAQLIQPIWDEVTLDSLWSYSRTYIHGHRTGGTNPALLRAAAAGTDILAFDNPFNREVLEEHGWYWHSKEQLGELLQEEPWLRDSKREAVKESTLRRYQWSAIAGQYEDLMKRVLSIRGK